METKKIKEIKEKFLQELEIEKDTEVRKRICKKYIEGELSSVFCLLKDLGEAKRIEIGKKANELRQFILSKMQEEAIKKDKKKEWIDVTLPGKIVVQGNIHPLTQLQIRCEQIFSRMGFVVVEGPEVEDEWHNFDALNVEQDHPAREMQDTLFIKQKNREDLSSSEKLLMRTHTSPVQIRYMKENKPPFRIITQGKVFRNEATDSSHDVNFYQMEGLMIGDDVSIANFKSVVRFFFKQLFKSNVDIRLRPSFFPFTEPSFEIDVTCSICNKKGCRVCQNTGWLEVMGAGMVHPNVLKSVNIDSEKFNGFAFGVGIDRIAMIMHEVDDIRLFYSGDLRFLKQF